MSNISNLDFDSATNEEIHSLTWTVFNSMCKVAILDNWKIEKYGLSSKKLIAFHSPIGLIRFYFTSSNREINLSLKDTRKLSRMVEYLESRGHL